MRDARRVREQWNRFRDKRRRVMRCMAQGRPDANTRRRAQIVIALVQEKSVQDIADVLQCSRSLVYKTAGPLRSRAYFSRKVLPLFRSIYANIILLEFGLRVTRSTTHAIPLVRMEATFGYQICVLSNPAGASWLAAVLPWADCG